MTQISGRRTGAGADRSHATPKEALHPDVYPIGRVATEFFLRCFEVVGRLHEDVVSSQIIMTLWRDALVDKDGREPASVRKLSRRLDLPFETVRRHVRELVRSGVCLAEDDGIRLAASMRRSARAAAMLRRIYLSAERLLDALRRMKVASYRPRRSPLPSSRRLDEEQTAIVVAAIDVLLATMTTLRGFFGGSLVCGLVFTAIRAANVKHIANNSPAANRDILQDSDRRPVSILAISNSMRLPYETVRRHAGTLVRQGKCIRVGRQGLMAPASTFRQMNVEANTVRQLVLGFLAELRAAGVKV